MTGLSFYSAFNIPCKGGTQAPTLMHLTTCRKEHLYSQWREYIRQARDDAKPAFTPRGNSLEIGLGGITERAGPSRTPRVSTSAEQSFRCGVGDYMERSLLGEGGWYKYAEELTLTLTKQDGQQSTDAHFIFAVGAPFHLNSSASSFLRVSNRPSNTKISAEKSKRDDKQIEIYLRCQG